MDDDSKYRTRQELVAEARNAASNGNYLESLASYEEFFSREAFQDGHLVDYILIAIKAKALERAVDNVLLYSSNITNDVNSLKILNLFSSVEFSQHKERIDSLNLQKPRSIDALGENAHRTPPASVPMERKVIFVGQDLMVVSRLSDTKDLVVVTFTGRGLGQTYGFGEEFLTSSGVPNINFISLKDHWWQTPEMKLALESVKALTSCFSTVATYGSSMGGFAALNYADEIGATRVLCFAPQASSNPDTLPHDQRWIEDRRSYTSIHDMLWKKRKGDAKIFVVYDKFDQDREHVKLFDASDVHHMVVPFVGHAVLGFFNRIGVLKEFSLSILNGQNGWSKIQNLVLKRRRGFQPYWVSLIKKALKSNRTQLAQRLLRRSGEFKFHARYEWLELAAIADGLQLVDEFLQFVRLAQNIAGDDAMLENYLRIAKDKYGVSLY